jgi:TolB-like protein/Tfp pilus assembly protein PilF/predicted Ser/Thr protein kinase
MPLQSGDKLGPYEILARVGTGGMGEVYKARDTRLERVVAIKQCKALHRGRFEQEARVIAALNHPHICQVFDVGSDYLVMEYVDGKTLSGPLPVGEALKLALEIVRGLEDAHGKGILHRDLKPANILVTAAGSAKILDFGLAKLMTESNPDATQTAAGTILGTPAYMAPEQAEGKPVDARSDIFSFGSVLYEMLSGNRAFPGDSAAQALSAVLRDEPAPLAISAELQKIIRKCLAKRPEDRFASMAELRRALEQSASPSGAASKGGSEAAAGEQGFGIAVIPFKVSGAGADLPALAEGLTEDIVAGLSRFFYLRVFTKESAGVARYVIEGSLRQTGSQLRLAVQLADTASGARLWADTYNRSYSPEAIFDIQDSLVPPIVATVAEWNGVLIHNIWMALRDRDARTFTPYEALLRSSGFGELLTPEEYQLALAILTRAIEQEPNHSGCLGMLSHMHAYGYLFSFGGGEDSRDASLYYARRAVAADSSNHHAFYTLALAHSCRKEIAAFRSAAERAIALNPMDGHVMAHVGMWTAYSGDWERGCELVKCAMKLNPRHTGWYWYPLAHDAYRRTDYALALEYALRLNMPGLFWTHELLARIHTQLGNRAAASEALKDLAALRPDFPANARREFERFFVESSFIDQMLDGLRLAGLKIDIEDSAAHAVARPAPSIAVLPFENLSADKDQQYFSDGLAEEILNALVKVPGLRVIARASAFAFRNRENAVAEIGEKLGVLSILHGAVRRSGSRIRVTAQLIDVSDETQLWSERYDREMRDIFDIQDEIAQAIVAQLKVKLSAKPSGPLVKRYTENLEAHSLYLRGVFHVNRLTNDEMQLGRLYLEKAIALDPFYAPALLQLAEYYVATGHRGGDLPCDQWPKVRALAAKALEADPEFADAHAAIGFMAALGDFQWEDALRALDSALQLNPACALAHFWRSYVLFIAGSEEEALAAIHRAVEIDPLRTLFHTYMATYSLLLGRPEQALDHARRGLEVDPGFPPNIQLLGETYSVLGRHEEAAGMIEKTLPGVPSGYFYSALLAWVYVRSGRREDANRLRASLEETAKLQYVSSGARAFVAAALDETDLALTYLEEAIRERDPNIPLWIRSQYFRALHGSARFDQLLRSMNLSQ